MFFVGFLLVAAFLYWQFRMLKKYALKYDKCSVNVPEKCVVINGQQIAFEAIEAVTVKELPQPAVYERMLSKSAAYVYMTEVTFHLKDGLEMRCVFNHKAVLYKTLKQLEPVVSVQADLEQYKPRANWVTAVILFVFILGIIIAVMLPIIFRH